MLWKIYNAVYAWWYEVKGTGVLPDKEDKRDKNWVGLFQYKPKHEMIDWASDEVGKNWRFDQAHFNICVFASAAMAASFQNGVRLSVRWLVKLAKREGMINGNGFSYLRAAKKMANQYGHLPYFYMPDEISNMSWEEYSRWTPQDNDLLEIAKDFKTKSYSRIRTTGQAFEAIESGYCISTASKWYADNMNNPRSPFILFARGGYIGGHAYAETGHKTTQFIITNSFGRNYGFDGQVYDNGLFEAHDYAIWIEDRLSGEVLGQHVSKEHDLGIVKGSGAALYLLIAGQRRAFRNGSSYDQWKMREARDPKIIHLRDFVLNSIPEGEMI